VTLSELPLGKSARIKAISGERGFRRRLLELGLLPETLVRVLRVAPLGDPLELQVRGTCLSIRRSEASQIDVIEERVPA
jgi:ferrous iron transport protein A